jgi:hypothetical protein
MKTTTMQTKTTTTTTRRMIALTIALLMSGLAAGAGCSFNSNSGPKAAEGLAAAKSHLSDSQTQVDRTLVAMDNLGRTGNLKLESNTFNLELSKLQDAAKKAGERARAMKDNAANYQTAWKEEVADIKDPALRAGSEQRKAAVQSHYDAVIDKAAAVREAYAPFVSDLKDIQKSLSLDQSSAAVSAIDPVRARAHQSADALKKAISNLSAELDQI